MRTWALLGLISAIILLAGCDSKKKNDSSPFGNGVSLGVNTNRKLEEVSGLIASVNFPGCLWTHNDSGNPAKIFLLDDHAKTRRTYELAGVDNRDWEDIAMGPGPQEGINYLYIGDIGDNLRRYSVKYIYRFPEPTDGQSETIDAFDTLIVKLEDGIFDSEAFTWDPVSKNLYLFSKQAQTCGVYEIKFPFTADTLVAKRLYDISHGNVNAADISRDGSEILIKNYDNIYYWKKSGSESIAELVRTPPVDLSYDREPQGEAVAWAADGSGFYTLGENAKGARAKLYFYKRKMIGEGLKP
ncbi:MAG TPA: hypothetical protein VG737_15015 [Cyclobacteriaceae bacterium]|nr:hypothetical protein [Cyclobacteriaceae bacterium]